MRKKSQDEMLLERYIQEAWMDLEWEGVSSGSRGGGLMVEGSGKKEQGVPGPHNLKIFNEICQLGQDGILDKIGEVVLGSQRNGQVYYRFFYNIVNALGLESGFRMMNPEAFGDKETVGLQFKDFQQFNEQAKEINGLGEESGEFQRFLEDKMHDTGHFMRKVSSEEEMNQYLTLAGFSENIVSQQMYQQFFKGFAHEMKEKYNQIWTGVNKNDKHEVEITMNSLGYLQDNIRKELGEIVKTYQIAVSSNAPTFRLCYHVENGTYRLLFRFGNDIEYMIKEFSTLFETVYNKSVEIYKVNNRGDMDKGQASWVAATKNTAQLNPKFYNWVTGKNLSTFHKIKNAVSLTSYAIAFPKAMLKTVGTYIAANQGLKLAMKGWNKLLGKDLVLKLKDGLKNKTISQSDAIIMINYYYLHQQSPEILKKYAIDNPAGLKMLPGETLASLLKELPENIKKNDPTLMLVELEKLVDKVENAEVNDIIDFPEMEIVGKKVIKKNKNGKDVTFLKFQNKKDTRFNLASNDNYSNKQKVNENIRSNNRLLQSQIKNEKLLKEFAWLVLPEVIATAAIIIDVLDWALMGVNLLWGIKFIPTDLNYLHPAAEYVFRLEDVCDPDDKLIKILDLMVKQQQQFDAEAKNKKEI